MSGVTDIDCLANSGDGLQCALDSIAAAFGSDIVFGFVVGSAAILGLYIASSYHPAPPTIGTMLFGGMLIPALPAQYQRIGMVVMLMGLIAGIFVTLRRYVLEVGR
jgi:hypothetical protein